MPDYVRRGGLDIAPPPYACDDIDARVFYAQARREKLQALCDRTLNTAPRARAGAERFAPLSDLVAVTFQEFRELHSLDDPHHGGMRHSYREASFWVLVQGGAGRPRVMVPYMFVDQWVAVAAGRELFGFPKEHAALQGAWDGAPPVFEVEALSGAPGSASQPRRIVRVAPADAADFRIQPSGAQAAREAMGPVEWLEDVFLGATLRMVFQREVRALGGGHGADLQQVTAVDAQPFTMNGLLPTDLFSGYRMELLDVASHPIRDDFGFGPGPVPLLGGFRASFRFRLQPGAPLA